MTSPAAVQAAPALGWYHPDPRVLRVLAADRDAIWNLWQVPIR